MTTIDPIAQAIRDADIGPFCEPWERCGSINQNRYRRMAQAALHAMTATPPQPAHTPEEASK